MPNDVSLRELLSGDIFQFEDGLEVYECLRKNTDGSVALRSYWAPHDEDPWVIPAEDLDKYPLVALLPRAGGATQWMRQPKIAALDENGDVVQPIWVDSPEQMPNRFWHGAGSDVLPSILKRGLRSGAFLADDKDYARYHGNGVVLEIAGAEGVRYWRTTEIDGDNYNIYKAVQVISPQRISIVEGERELEAVTASDIVAPETGMGREPEEAAVCIKDDQYLRRKNPFRNNNEKPSGRALDNNRNAAARPQQLVGDPKKVTPYYRPTKQWFLQDEGIGTNTDRGYGVREDLAPEDGAASNNVFPMFVSSSIHLQRKDTQMKAYANETPEQYLERLVGQGDMPLEDALEAVSEEMKLSTEDADKMYEEFLATSESVPAAVMAVRQQWRRVAQMLEAAALPPDAWTVVYSGVKGNRRYNLHQALGDLNGYAARQGMRVASAQVAPEELANMVAMLRHVVATAHLLPFDEQKHIAMLMQRVVDQGLKGSDWHDQRFRDLYGGREEGRRMQEKGLPVEGKPSWVRQLEVMFNSPYATDDDKSYVKSLGGDGGSYL